MQIRVEKPLRQTLFKRQNVAAYARVSVENELTEHSLKNQVEFYSSYIKKNPLWNFAGVYADEGLTGTKADRPGFQSLLKDCEEGKINIILCKSISRLARNTVDLLNTTRHLKELDINIWFEKENIWSMSPEGELILTLLASFAQEESRSVSENTKWAIRKKFEKGIGNKVILYGYKWDGKEYHIVPEQAEVVREVFSLYLEGRSPDQIALIMQKRGVKSPEGNAFSYSFVRDMLRMEKYTGNSVFQKTYVENHLTKKMIRNHGEMPKYYATETHPPIIDKQIFDAVQEEIKRRAELGYRANQSISFSCFTSKLICAKCGRTYRRRMTGMKGRMTKTYRWACGTRIKGTSIACDAQNIPDIALHELTKDVLQTDNITKELFDSFIDHIEVSAHSTLSFFMKDGRVEERHWKVMTNNTNIREKINGKNSDGHSSNKE